jgi:GntR family transcriptional regulator
MGTYTTGMQLPSEAELQTKYNLSRITVRRAILELVREGYLIKSQGKGTFVNRAQLFKNQSNVRSFTQICEMQGKITDSVVLINEMVEGTDSQCDFFDIPHGSKIAMIKRIRRVDGKPMMLETNYLHPNYKGLLEFNLTHSLYKLLITEFNTIPDRKGLNELTIIYAKGEIAIFLNVPEGQPLISNRIDVFDMAGNPLHQVVTFVVADMADYFKYYV